MTARTETLADQLEHLLSDKMKEELAAIKNQVLEKHVDLATTELRQRLSKFLSEWAVDISAFASFERIGADLRITVRNEFKRG